MIFDITHPLGPATAAWPGDTEFTMAPDMQIAKGDAVNVARLTLSPHNGSHADAPYHYDNAGLTMDQVDPSRYIGPALLVALEGRTSISAADLRTVDMTGVERLLVRTGSCPNLTRFNPDFTYFEPDAIRYLVAQGIRLIGTDAHSMDPFHSRDLPSHHACAAGDLLILENLSLSEVPAGRYELIALPLKLAGCDGSPVRAVLRTLP